MFTLTVNTQIPTSARGTIRALVKSHPAWPAFLTEKGLISASARNSDLLEFALRHAALAQQITDILSAQAADAITHGTTDMSLEEEIAEVLADANAAAPAQATGAFDANTILASVDQFLSPLVRAELSKALSPVIDAANKPAEEKIIEVERVIEVAPGETPRIVRPKAKRGTHTTFRALFPSRAKDVWRDAKLTLWTGVPAPAIDPFYVVNHEQFALLLTAIERGTNVWLAGPAGTGKSSMAEQAAAWLCRPFVKLGMTRQTEVDALVGGMALVNGATVWQDGALVAAMRQPGTVICVDELTFAQPGVQAIFQLVADDHRTLTLPTGEVVKCADGVVFVVADNTTGAGDEGALYAGTNVSNSALVTRFKRMIFVDYLSVQQEAEALANHTACPMKAAMHLAQFVATARKLPALAGVVLSLRQMVGFIQCVQDGFAPKRAFDIAMSSRMPATEKAAIEALVTLTWAQEFDAYMNNRTAPVQPSNSAASKAFSDDQY